MAGPGETTLDDLLSPRSVAVIGASDDPARIGGRPIAYLKDGGFVGDLYPINPKRDRVQGLATYGSIDDVTGPVDFAVVAVPAAITLEAVGQCAAKGVKTCLVFTSGFAELDAEGAQAQDQMVDIATAAGMRLIGPNCLGVFNSTIGFFPTFTSSLDRGFPEAGPYAIATQSGAYGSHIYYLAKQRGLDIRYWITTGNEADVDVAEAIHLFADDADTHVIMAYTEGVTDGARLVAALERARANAKPVVLMKVGRSEVGAAAIATHTAALAGQDRVYDAIFRQYGAHRARTTEELLDVAYACRRRIYPAGNRIGLVTISGGGGILMADAAAEHGLDVAPMPEAAQAALKQALPFASPRNPVDITAQAFNDLSLVEKNVRIMLEMADYDVLLAFFTMVAGSRLIADDLRAAVKAGIAGHEDRLIAMSMIASDDLVAAYEADGFPVFEDPSRAIQAVAALTRFGEAFARGGESAPEIDRVPLPEGPLGERQAKAALAAAGLPMVEDRLVTTAEEAVKAGAAFDGAVVLKIASPDIAHKTEIGGVLRDVSGEAALAAGFETLMKRARSKRPDARLDGVLVAPMIGGGVECILGVTSDPAFGPMVLFGLGGVFAEVMEDVTLRRAPFGTDEARRMIGEIKGRAVLAGVRGAPRADVDALAEALARLSAFAAAHADDIESVDLNPFVIRPEGHGAIALDALIVHREARASR